MIGTIGNGDRRTLGVNCAAMVAMIGSTTMPVARIPLWTHLTGAYHPVTAGAAADTIRTAPTTVTTIMIKAGLGRTQSAQIVGELEG